MLHSITEETHIHKQVLVFLVLLLLLLLVFYKQVRVSISSLSQSFQLHNSPVTRQKFRNPFYPLKVTFLPSLPDHIPLLSHRAVVTSCLQAASLPLQTTLSPAASSLKSHKYSPCSIPDLYHSTLTSDFSSVQYFQSCHFSPTFELAFIGFWHVLFPPVPVVSFILWLSPQMGTEFEPCSPGTAFGKTSTYCIHQKSVWASREEILV